MSKRSESITDKIDRIASALERIADALEANDQRAKVDQERRG